VVAHCRQVVAAEGVQDADGVGLVHEVGDFAVGSPAEGGCFVVGGEVAAGDSAAENQGDDAAGHVLVHAGERVRLDAEPGLLADLAAQPVGDGLAEFEDAAGGFPVLVVAAADEQDAAVVVGDDAADADRVPGQRSVHEITSRVAY
jgi:hypothetical protein